MQVRVAAQVPTGWDDYVRRHPQGSAWHRAAAVEIGRVAHGLRTWFVSAHDESGGIVGALPLVEQSSLVFGRYLNAVPYFTYGGILADNDEVAAALAGRAAGLAAERKCSHLELRQFAALGGLDLAERRDKVTMLLELPGTGEALAGMLGSKLRSQVRRAEREDPEVRIGGAELLPDFYAVFSANMHYLGTPVYGRRFFDAVYDALQDVLEVFVIRVGGRPEAAAITVNHGSRVEVPWAAASLAAKRTAVNMRLYFEMLKRTVDAGVGTFDFGRCTPDSGTYRFKAQWGAKPHQLHWYYWLRSGHSVPQLNNANPRYALAVSAWRRLPLRCANLLGPIIAKNLP